MLDELPKQTTERLEWRQGLGDEWPMVEPLLRHTGRVVQAVACPFPSGDGCPRRVVRHGDGRVVAVCGERPQRCEAITLEQDDIEALELNAVSFSDLLRRVLALGEPRESAATLFPIGTLGVRAGFGLPVLLAFPNTDQLIMARDLPDATVGIVLTPTGRFVAALPAGWTPLSLADVLGVGPRGAIVATEAWTGAADAIKAHAVTTTEAREIVWNLPPDARWEEMTFEFIGPELLHVRFRGDTRAFEPVQLGMRHKRSGKATLLWTALQAFAECGGEISWTGPGADTRLKKRKQLLSYQLIRCFGIPGDPIVWDDRAYRTRFKIIGTPIGVRRREDARR